VTRQTPVVVEACTQSVASASAVAVAVASRRMGSQSHSGLVAGSFASARGRSQIASHYPVVGLAGFGSSEFVGGGRSESGMQERRAVVGGCSCQSIPPQTLRQC